MGSNAQKTPLARTLNEFAERKAAGAIALLGKSLPASVTAIQGSIVTVKFEIQDIFTLAPVTVPIAGSEYIRLPIQVGCLGWVMSADAYLGGMSGLGGGVADLSLHANLSCLVWSPIGNKNWSAPTDPNKLELYGPDGAILRTLDKATSITVSASGVAIKVPTGKTVNIATLPVSAVGLSPGDLWNSGGNLKVV